MEIEGTYTLQATPHEVWNGLLDSQVWVHEGSALEEATQVDTNAFRLTFRLNHAPLIGMYTTRATITEQHAPYYCRVTFHNDNALAQTNEQAEAINGYGILHLNQQEHHTVVAYKGDITSRVLDDAGNPVATPVVKGTVKLLLQQFFTTLSERVHEKQRIHMNGSDAHAHNHTDELFITHEERIILPSPLAYSSHEQVRESSIQRSRLRWFIHVLGIGKGDAAEEIRWTQRIRRFSIASILLFLVWVGTRIPRR